MKTPAFRAAMKPLRDAQSHALATYESERAVYEAERQKYEAQRKAWNNNPSGEPPPEPIAPRPARYMVSDTTLEALACVLKDNPRGVLLARDELSAWLGSFDKYAKGGKGGGDAAAWLSMYDAEPLLVDRKTEGTLYAPRAGVSICGGVQPQTLRRALGEEHRENGLAARMLVAFPPRRKKVWTDEGLPPSEEANLALLVDNLLGHRAGDDGEPVMISLDPAAKAAFIRFFEQHAHEQVELTGPIAAAFSKLEGIAARIALIVHKVRVAAGDETVVEPCVVDEESMQRAIRLAEWFKNEARRVHHMLTETSEQREQRERIDWIRAKGGGVTARDLQRTSRRYATARDAEAVLDELVAAGLATWVQPPQCGPGKPPAKVCRLIDPGVGADQTTGFAGKKEDLVNVDVAGARNAPSEWGEGVTI